jgi:phosphopantothenoylcysteine decarboxylase/phosphopantothenate--cysteine ligase
MKHLVLCVTGSIAAWKAAALLTQLRGRVDVTVAMTESATQFVGPQTFLALTGNPVITSLWEPTHTKPKHIDLADRLDGLLIAPATANALAKLAHGIADDAVSTLAISVLPSEKPVMVAPAMNTRMWEHPATRENLAKLRAWGIHVIEPGEGDLACGWKGMGRLAEPDVIAAAVLSLMGQ